jgi:hypothetical protein
MEIFAGRSAADSSPWPRVMVIGVSAYTSLVAAMSCQDPL